MPLTGDGVEEGKATACACGKKREGAQFSASIWEDTPLNERQMLILNGDATDCEPYHGAFQGAHVHVVGQGTEHERVFLRNNRKAAEQYAAGNSVKVGRLVSVRSLCHQRIVAALGA